MSDRFVCIITVRDYQTDDDMRDFADELMARYGYDRNQVSEIRYTDKRIEFQLLDRTGSEPSYKRVGHDR